MNALRLTGFGDPAQLVALVSEPEPHVGHDELLVALEAAPVHPTDLHLIRVFYRVSAELPVPLGAEGVGRVIEIGPGGRKDRRWGRAWSPADQIALHRELRLSGARPFRADSATSDEPLLAIGRPSPQVVLIRPPSMT
jgi:NADPH:quinone reductase-like Zn-dependent oxidoreductase